MASAQASRNAARAAGLSNGHAESPLESEGRLALLAAGLPLPELQVELHDSRGFVARIDAWYDDVAMKIAFEVCAGSTRWVDGSAWHLWHKPGLGGSHRTAEDKAATARNKERLELYRQATTPERIRELTAGGR